MIRKRIRRLMIVGLALLVLAPGTSAWGSGRSRHFRSGQRLGHQDGMKFRSGFTLRFRHGRFRHNRSLRSRRRFRFGHRFNRHHPKLFHAPHGFPHNSRRNSFSTSKRVWVPGRWVKSTHGVLIWKKGHWTINVH